MLRRRVGDQKLSLTPAVNSPMFGLLSNALKKW